MVRKKFIVCLAVLILTVAGGIAVADDLTPLEQLGKALFFDSNLSTPPGQSCAACHAPEVGFTGPDSYINLTQAIYPGVVHTRAGNRKPPTAAYGGDSPVMYYDPGEGLWLGGMFWDGRATGLTLGDPLAEQALGPFLNPLEQNSPVARLVLIRVAHSDYASLFEEVWGSPVDFKKGVALTYERIGRSIAAYERSTEVNPFSSKYDIGTLTSQEQDGLELFEGKAMCSACHTSGSGEVFTDFSYDNLGVPKNPMNPFYSLPRKWNPDGTDWVDPGLGGFLMSAGYLPVVYEPELGKHKVPTLRNVDKRPDPGFVKAYGHNGYFKSLKGIVHFYNTRDVKGICPGDYTEAQALVENCWPQPEVMANVNVDELGDLGLTDEEEDAIVAFLQALSDGYTP